MFDMCLPLWVLLTCACIMHAIRLRNVAGAAMGCLWLPGAASDSSMQNDCYILLLRLLHASHMFSWLLCECLATCLIYDGYLLVV